MPYVVPPVDLTLANAVESDVKSGKTFYSVAPPVKTGTLPTKAIVADSNLYEEGYHAGNVGGLSAVDTDLDPANILQPKTIFGKTGTLPIHQDIQSGLYNTGSGLGSTAYFEDISANIDPLRSVTLTLTRRGIVYATGSIFAYNYSVPAATFKLFINGVEVASSAFVAGAKKMLCIKGNLTCDAGSKVVKTTIVYTGGTNSWSGDGLGAGVG